MEYFLIFLRALNMRSIKKIRWIEFALFIVRQNLVYMEIEDWILCLDDYLSWDLAVLEH